MIAAAAKHSDAIVSFGVFARRYRLRGWWTAIGADAVALSKLSAWFFNLMTCGCGAAGHNAM